MSFIYQKAVVGGTFDHFHLGHQKLLETAFEQSQQVTIGITQPQMYEKKFLAEVIEEYALREKSVKDFLTEKGLIDRASLIPITDIFGNTLQEKDIQAIFVTEENVANVQLINDKRHEVGFPEIKPVVVSYILDQTGQPITSERIRKGEIDRQGVVYTSIFEKQEVLTLPDSLRPTLQEPIGEVIATTDEVVRLVKEKTHVIAVGDIIVQELKKDGVVPAISVIDFKTRRHEIDHEMPADALEAHNAPGTVNQEAVNAFTNALKHFLETKSAQTIVIDGEEDLLALPAILLSPLGSVVLYGQFDRGVVVNYVTEELKQKINGLVQRFEK
jgi:cytidyltransferase-like protein